jgi:hypothetical protein
MSAIDGYSATLLAIEDEIFHASVKGYDCAVPLVSSSHELKDKSKYHMIN